MQEEQHAVIDDEDAGDMEGEEKQKKWTKS